MKVAIKTEFWNCEDVDMWKVRYQKLSFNLMIMFLANLAYFIFNWSYLMFILNIMVIIMLLFIEMSYNKRDKKDEKERS